MFSSSGCLSLDWSYLNRAAKVFDSDDEEERNFLHDEVSRRAVALKPPGRTGSKTVLERREIEFAS